jgi:hypothetical protein
LSLLIATIPLVVCCKPRRRGAVDLALDGEQRIDMLHRLDRDRCLVQSCQVEELAPRVRPARRLHDGTRLAGGLVEPVEARIGGAAIAGVISRWQHDMQDASN